MTFDNEALYYYYLMIRANLIDFSEYEKWLDDAFMLENNSGNSVLLDLESSTNNKEQTINIIYEYFNDKAANLNETHLGKLFASQIKKIYLSDQYSIEYLAKKLYEIWQFLPHRINQREPFSIMCYVDDPLSYGDKNRTIELLEEFMNYY